MVDVKGFARLQACAAFVSAWTARCLFSLTHCRTWGFSSKHTNRWI